MNCICMGTFQGIPFELFVFPNGNYYSLEHIAIIFFKDNRTKLLSCLPPHLLTTALCQDSHSKSVYISSTALKTVGEVVGIQSIVGLSALTMDTIMSGGSRSLLSTIEGMEANDIPEDSTMTITVAPYVVDQKR